MQGQQQRPQPGILPKHEVVDARVFETLDGQALQRAQVVGHLRLAPAAVTGHVGQGGPVTVQPAGAARAAEVVIDVGKGDAMRVEEGRGHAAVIETGAVAQQGCVVLPQAAQREFQLTLHRHQQRAMPLALQHGAAVCGLQGKVVALAIGMVLVVARAVIGPARQAGHVEHIQRPRRVFQKHRQAGAFKGGVVPVDGHRGALHQFAHYPQVVTHRPGPQQAARHCRQALQQRCYRPAVGRLLHRLHLGDHVVEQVFADGAGHRRPLLQEGQHRLRAPAHAAQRVGAVQVSVDAPGAKGRPGLLQAVGQHILHRRKAAGQARAPDLQLRRFDGSGERFRRCSGGGHDAVGSSVVVRTDGPTDRGHASTASIV
jgi:hypothetical protein